jgi:hypothetical protein
MANWVETILRITGSDDDIAEFKKRTMVPAKEVYEDAKNDNDICFDFRAIIPLPKGNKFPPKQRWVRDNWYAYPGFDYEILKEQPGYLKVSFITKWYPPIPIFERMGDVFPKLTIDLACHELGSPGPNFAFDGKIENGKLDCLWELDCETLLEQLEASPPDEGEISTYTNVVFERFKKWMEW